MEEELFCVLSEGEEIIVVLEREGIGYGSFKLCFILSFFSFVVEIGWDLLDSEEEVISV